MTEKLQRDHSMDIDALKEEMAKVKTAGEDRKKQIMFSLLILKELVTLSKNIPFF